MGSHPPRDYPTRNLVLLAEATTPVTPEEIQFLAQKHIWTPEEKREQCVSFAYGNVKLHNPDLKKEVVYRMYDKLHPEVTSV